MASLLDSASAQSIGITLSGRDAEYAETACSASKDIRIAVWQSSSTAILSEESLLPPPLQHMYFQLKSYKI